MINGLVLTLLSGGLAVTLLINGDFERGLEGWITQHSWYEKPQGAGLSELLVVEGEGPDGSKALKILGVGKRGLAMQVRPAYPGRYRVAGWIKCENVEAGQAGVLAEWLDRQNKWMRGDWAVQVSGSQDWKRFDAVVEAPLGTRSVHFDLLTTEPNNGTVWFDNLEFERLPSDFPAPRAPSLSASTPQGREGCLEVTWDTKKLTEGTIRLLVFCEPEPIEKVQNALPKAVLDSEEGRGIIWSLENNRNYYLAAIAVNADGKRSTMSPVVQAQVKDRQPPRPGWIEAKLMPGSKRVEVSWSPHLLDTDVKTIHLCVPSPGKRPMRELKAVNVSRLYKVSRPLYCTEPWIKVQVQVPEGTKKVGLWCEDKAGNIGELSWAEVQPSTAIGGAATAPCLLWTLPPTEQVRRDAEPPSSATANFDLVLMRGQAKGFQVVVKPKRDLHHTRVRFEPLLSEDGRCQIHPRWLTYHFVNYVRLEKNSCATPAEELVWPAPADYPDELSDDIIRNLPAGQAQPIYIRITAPRDAKPALYRGRGYIECHEGRREFKFSIRVASLELPKQLQLKFVYWFSWDAPCKQFGVEQFSEDGWRVLARLAQLMQAHHQNAAVVPWSLVHTWRNLDGKLTHDFRDFDRFVKTFQAEGVNRLFCISHIGARTTGEWGCPTMSSHGHIVRRIDTGEQEQIDVMELLPSLERHIEEMGLLGRFALHIADEPIPQNIESYRQLSERAKRAAPRLPRIDAIHVPDLKNSLEIWVPQLNYFEQWLDQYRTAQREGNEIWFYIAWVPQGHYPNRMIDSHAIKSRVLHWLNALYDTSGYLHWALNHWQIPLDSLESPGDQYICWPSRRFIANSSLRYEAQREGLEDCELMSLLRSALEKGGLTHDEAQRQVENIARKAVRNFQNYTRSWQELEAVRHELLNQLAPP